MSVRKSAAPGAFLFLIYPIVMLCCCYCCMLHLSCPCRTKTKGIENYGAETTPLLRVFLVRCPEPVTVTDRLLVNIGNLKKKRRLCRELRERHCRQRQRPPAYRPYLSAAGKKTGAFCPFSIGKMNMLIRQARGRHTKSTEKHHNTHCCGVEQAQGWKPTDDQAAYCTDSSAGKTTHRIFGAPFKCKRDHVTKTGSGQP